MARTERIVIDSPSGLEHLRNPLARIDRLSCPVHEFIVYYLERADGLIKIGTTGNYPQRRKRLLREHGPLSLVAWELGSYALERARHDEMWQDRRGSSEWFLPSPYLVDHVLNLRALIA